METSIAATAPVPATRPTVQIIRVPRPFMRGACIVRCSEARLSGCFVSLAAARVYVATLITNGQAVGL